MRESLIFACITSVIVCINIHALDPENIEPKNELEAKDQLIAREILFGNPDKIAPSLSPDGKYISFLAPKDGVLNIWLAPYDDLGKAKVITHEKKRGIRSYFWAKNNTHIIFSQDKNGDENWRLYSVDIRNLKQKDLTPIDGVSVSVLKLSDKFPSEALILINDRVPEYHDVYKINVESGDKTLIYKNIEEFAGFTVDEDFNIRFANKMLANGESVYYKIDKNNGISAKKIHTIAPEDTHTSSFLHLVDDGKKLYMIDSAGRNTAALFLLDLATQNKELIFADSRADIDDFLVNPTSKKIEGVAVDYLKKEWSIFNDAISRDIKNLEKVDEGKLEIMSRTLADDKWIVAYVKDNGPKKYYFYDRANKKNKFLFVANKDQEGLPFARMYPLTIKARDGLSLVSYLTIPRWLDNGEGRPTSPIPLVLHVHGGPNARDTWGFDAVDQWLANRGYAVLNVNFRGSTGFGKNFINAADGQWSRAMQDDLDDAVQWAIQNKIAQKDKIAIMGTSYGGYAALVGLTRNPDLYALGIDVVGPSNLVTLLKSIPPYWKPTMATLIKGIGGSPDTEEGRLFLKERSPLTHVKNIKKPLFIVQGANDPRVKKAESDQIVAAMEKHKIPVFYLLYPDEGHGLARPENRLSFYAYAEAFLANILGGGYLPHDNKFPGSSVEIKAGKDLAWTAKELPISKK